jgi:hypothetical protein
MIKLFVAYSTMPVPGFEPDPGAIEAPAHYKDPEKIAEYKAKAAVKLKADAAFMPYTGTFAEVQIVDPARRENLKWEYRAPDSGKQPLCLAVRAWLVKNYGQYFPESMTPARDDRGRPEVVFVGFDPRLFLKMLGTECSLPEYVATDKAGKPTGAPRLPLSLWFANSDHRDIEQAAMPADYKGLTWDVVLKRRQLRDRFPAWERPHEDVTADVDLTVALATQLGMLDDD